MVIPNPPIWNGAIYLRSRRYGDVEQLRSGHIVLSIGNERLNLQALHTQTLDKDQVVKLRHLFRPAGVTPEHAELETGEKARRDVAWGDCHDRSSSGRVRAAGASGRAAAIISG